MSRRAYSEIQLHVVWHTKQSTHLIKPATAQDVYDCIRRRAVADGGVFVHEIGGTPNHIHMAVRVEPTVLISEWVGKVKGGSSHDLNGGSTFGGAFAWQVGYGVVSFGTGNLPWVRDYIRHQKRHHDLETWEERLERITEREICVDEG